MGGNPSWIYTIWYPTIRVRNGPNYWAPKSGCLNIQNGNVSVDFPPPPVDPEACCWYVRKNKWAKVVPKYAPSRPQEQQRTCHSLGRWNMINYTVSLSWLFWDMSRYVFIWSEASVCDKRQSRTAPNQSTSPSPEAAQTWSIGPAHSKHGNHWRLGNHWASMNSESWAFQAFKFGRLREIDLPAVRTIDLQGVRAGCWSISVTYSYICLHLFTYYYIPYSYILKNIYLCLYFDMLLISSRLSWYANPPVCWKHSHWSWTLAALCRNKSDIPMCSTAWLMASPCCIVERSKMGKKHGEKMEGDTSWKMCPDMKSDIPFP